ncbi:MAG TPA: hypothetical protein PKB06_07195, partial [Actinotalea sp.]|nr:hypothetical protein [Actinotalea sp.]
MTVVLPRWLWPLVTGLLVLLGAGALAAAAVLPAGGAGGVQRDAASAEAAPVPTLAPMPTLGPTDAPVDRSDDLGIPVHDRADAAWVAEVAAATGIPERALAAYAGASIEAGERFPACGLGWNTLAAIGLVESEHGTMNGASIGPDGVAAPTIVGVALDGQGVGSVPDTDGGALDGDPVWDRAVGPMQVIPETWNRYGQDGDRDGVVEVNDIDDAALAAAVLLCSTGGDLTTSDAW